MTYCSTAKQKMLRIPSWLCFGLCWCFLLSSSSVFAQFTPVAAPTWRNPYQWPFASWSIWNLPIGKGAVYVPATLEAPNQYIYEADPDVLILKPLAPNTTFYYNSAGWSGQNRCLAEGQALFAAPFPPDFIVHSDGNNYSGAFLMPNNHTIRQGQPVAHCSVDGNVTLLVKAPTVDLYTDGILGAHGGSGLSSIGGTLRLGELLPGGYVARHALKTNLFARLNYYRNGTDKTSCYRWPAVTCDGYFDDLSQPLYYNGNNTAVRQGSLLALNATVDINKLGLTSEAGLNLAWTFQNYGAYIVDDSAWNVFALETELSPNGVFTQEFTKAWNITWGDRRSAFAQDVKTIYANLYVVDNWNLAMYNVVIASNGTMGVGGGEPLQPWAPSSFSQPVTSTTSSSSSSASALPGWQNYLF